MSDFSIEFMGGPFDGDVLEMPFPPPLIYLRSIYSGVTLAEPVASQRPVLVAVYEYRGGSYWYRGIET